MDYIIELYYTKWFRFLLVFVVLASSAGLLCGAFTLNSSLHSSTGSVSQEYLAPGGLLAGNPDLSQGAKKCAEALSGMERIIEDTGLFVNANAAQRGSFASYFEESGSWCTYAEYVSFENRHIDGWTRGVSIESLLGGS